MNAFSSASSSALPFYTAFSFWGFSFNWSLFYISLKAVRPNIRYLKWNWFFGIFTFGWMACRSVGWLLCLYVCLLDGHLPAYKAGIGCWANCCLLNSLKKPRQKAEANIKLRLVVAVSGFCGQWEFLFNLEKRKNFQCMCVCIWLKESNSVKFDI